MEAAGGMLGQFQEVKLASCFRGDEFGVSSVVFDPQEDLLWAGTYGVSLLLAMLSNKCAPLLKRFASLPRSRGDAVLWYGCCSL